MCTPGLGYGLEPCLGYRPGLFGAQRATLAAASVSRFNIVFRVSACVHYPLDTDIRPNTFRFDPDSKPSLFMLNSLQANAYLTVGTLFQAPPASKAFGEHGLLRCNRCNVPLHYRRCYAGKQPKNGSVVYMDNLDIASGTCRRGWSAVLIAAIYN
jgi:hypothetical protein